MYIVAGRTKVQMHTTVQRNVMLCIKNLVYHKDTLFYAPTLLCYLKISGEANTIMKVMLVVSAKFNFTF